MPLTALPHNPVTSRWLLALGLAAWTAACRDTLEPVDRAEPAPPPARTMTPTVSGKGVLPSMDTYIRSDGAHKNYGGHDSLVIQKIGKSGAARVLLTFPQAAIADSIGSDSLISGNIELTIKRTGTDWGTSGRAVAAHRLTRAWSELGATWNCANDVNVGNNKADCTGNTWSMTGSTPPFLTTPAAQSTITNGQSGVVNFDVTSDVRAFLADQVQNQGWLLKLAAESQTGTILFHSRESASKPRLVLTIMKKNVVPAEAPDTIPAWVYQPENFDSNTASIQVPFVKNILVIQFQQGTTQAEREAAVDSVAGSVIGGQRYDAGEGLYYLSVPDTTRGGALVAGATLLETLPQVGFASYDFAVDPGYLTPDDGPDWNAWHLNRDTLTGSNWGLEAIFAPMAWGCETGNSSTRVAVVDGFGLLAPPADLSHLTVHRIGALPQPSDPSHGILVSSVLGATGNNGTGMTGVMWDADIDGYEIGNPGISMLRIVARVKDAARSGAPIINLSWQAGRGASEDQQRRMGEALAGALRDLRLGTPSRVPLLVVIAGNYNRDARVSGFARVNWSSDSTHVLVVAAMARDSRLWRFDANNASNFGSLVDLAAPGESLGVLLPNGSLRRENGTSLAAPIVSGIAGLLLSFDDRITGPELRQIIKAAADSGAWNVVGADRPYPIANAYWALKLAALRPGAPLCGNRLWSDGTNVLASRTGGSEPLFAFNEPEYGVMELAAHHGGRRIDFLRTQNGQKRAFTLSGQMWSENPGVLADSGSVSGAWRSLYGFSHDGTQEVFADLQSYDAGNLTLKWYNGTSVVPYPSGGVPLPPLAQPDTGCAWKLISGPGTYHCAFLLTGVDEDAYPSVTFSPIGDRAVVASNVWRTIVTPNGGFSPCPWSEPHPEWGDESDLCVESITYELEPVRVDIYTFPMGGTATPLFSLSGLVVQTMEISEDGSQLIVQEGMEARRSTARPGGCPETMPTGWCNGDPEQVTPVGCQITYRSMATGAIIPPAIPTRQSCINGGVGSASPSIGRIGGPPRITLNRPSP
jgi:hypothetical protein